MADLDYKLEVNEPTLFYPCAGNDLVLPIECFSNIVENFYFVDTHSNYPPKLPNNYSLINNSRNHLVENPNHRKSAYVNKDTSHVFYVHRWKERGEDAIEKIPSIGIFFFRGDCPVDGEGSSGVLWFGEKLFDLVLKKMAKGGLIVTDGSNHGPNGPEGFSKFWRKDEIKSEAKDLVKSFNYKGREFDCIGYIGQKYGPTLVWQVLNS